MTPGPNVPLCPTPTPTVPTVVEIAQYSAPPTIFASMVAVTLILLLLLVISYLVVTAIIEMRNLR